jgi:hypothetical protein
MKHVSLLPLAAIALLPALATGQVKNTALGAQKFSGSIHIEAAPKAVWAVLTDATKICGILGYEWKGGAKKLENLGDNTIANAMGDEGRVFLTAKKPLSELRLAWEPENASYICQERWILKPMGKGTHVTYESRYTESGPQPKEALAQQEKELGSMLEKLKKALEG